MTTRPLEQGAHSLAEDFATIRAALTSSDLKEIQESILAGTATDREVEDHYRAFDPIEAASQARNERALYLQVKGLGRASLADFIGGAQILSSTLMFDALAANGGYADILPTLITEDNTATVYEQHERGNLKDWDLDNWDTIVDYTAITTNRPINTLAERVGVLHAARLTGRITGESVVSSIDDLKAISLGKAILAEGSRGFKHYIDIQRKIFLPTKIDAYAAEKIVDIAGEADLSTGLSELMLRSADAMDDLEAKDISLKELKNMIAPMLSWPTDARGTALSRYKGAYLEVDVSLVRDMQQESFIDGINSITRLANYARQTNPDMFKKGRIKGSLHEALWVLDAYAIRQGMPDIYGALCVGAATEAEDMPFIGNPNHKRGYDFVIRPQLNSTSKRLIQVGASGQKLSNKNQRPYHPDIEVYCEVPFNEVNLTTLEKKMALYAKWAEGGFTKQDYVRLKIHEQLLGTVKECFAAFQ